MSDKSWIEDKLESMRKELREIKAHDSIISFRSGSCRNAPEKRKSHTYVKIENLEGLFPMCGYGWNRNNGDGFSVFRGSFGTEGSCLKCKENLRSGKPPVTDGFKHKTKWI